jgi:hypothetical protein
METEHKYRYEQGWFVIIVGILFCGPAVPFLFLKGFENKTEFLINGIIHLSETPSSILLIAGGLLFTFMFYFSLRSLYLKFKEKNYLIINSKEIIIPANDSAFGSKRVPTVVPFNEITGVEEIQLNRRQFMLYITSVNTKTSVASVKMKNKKEYEEVKSVISERLRKAGTIT